MTEMTPADYAAINRGGGMGFGGDGAWWLIRAGVAHVIPTPRGAK